MKDLPITLRIALLVALVLSLAVILRQFVVEPSEEHRSEVVSTSEGESAAKPAPPKAELYPPVPAVLPDLNDGYLFNSDRRFEEVELDTARGGSGAVDLAEVSYAGSLIVGEIHKGLITYQDKSPASRRTIATPRGARTRRPTAKAVYKHKQLKLGENFMGYLVEKIEKDRIVFKKGDEVVEKFLYDPNKDRAGGGSAAKSQSAKPTRALPKTVGRAVQQIPARRSVSPARNVPRKRTDARSRRAMPSPGSDTPSAAELRKQRSERLLGLDPSLGIPPSPGIPGDPLRR